MISKAGIALSIGLLFLLAFTKTSLAETTAGPWLVPTSDPMHSKIEEDWNWLLIGGTTFAHGKSRTNFLGADPWERGWVVKSPWLELGLAYAPSSKWEFGLQVPFTILSTTINAYYSLNDFVKLGAKLGSLQTLSATFSAYTKDKNFFSLTPSVSLNQFGFPSTRKVNSAEFLEPEKIEELRQSRYLLGAQLSIGRQMNPADLALLIGYNFAPGHGVDNSFLFDDSLLKHFLRVSLAASF